MDKGQLLYKLCTEPYQDYDIQMVDQYQWYEGEFFVWVNYLWLSEFFDVLVDIFGNGIFDEMIKFNAITQQDCLYINLSSLLDSSINLEEIFPKDNN